MAITLVVEDGTQVADANTYASSQDYLDYFALRGVNESGAPVEDVKAALVKAAAYIDGQYGGAFKGQRISRAQGLLWPRLGVLDDEGFCIATDEIPEEVVKAQLEIAFRIRGGEDVYKDLKPGDGQVSAKKVGPIEIEWGGRGAMFTSPVNTYRVVDDLLESVCDGVSGMTARLVRG